MKILQKRCAVKKSFTLVEMIIVMTIIGLLALVSVSSYAVVQRRARLDTAVDGIINIIKEQRGKARIGKSEASKELSCYGIFFDQKNADSALKIVSMRYVAVDRNRADFCDPARSFTAQAADILQDTITIKNIALGSIDKENIKTFALFFKPPLGLPFGAMAFDSNALSSAFPLSADRNPVKIIFGIRDVTEERSVIFDVLTGAIKTFL